MIESNETFNILFWGIIMHSSGKYMKNKSTWDGINKLKCKTNILWHNIILNLSEHVKESLKSHKIYKNIVKHLV
jgi:hypothetical protein